MWCCLLAVSSGVGLAAETRTWTSTVGTTIEAAFIQMDASGYVHFKTSDGRDVKVFLSQLVASDQAVVRELSKPPAANPFWTNLVGKDLLGKDGNVIPSSELGKKKLVGLYFSAHWCAPCRQFTPSLVQSYNEWQKAGEDIEIVFVSSDTDKRSMQKYMQEAKMPWMAVPYSERTQKRISDQFGVRGIPMLVILDSKGKVIAKDARMVVAMKKAAAINEWRDK